MLGLGPSLTCFFTAYARSVKGIGNAIVCGFYPRFASPYTLCLDLEKKTIETGALEQNGQLC